MDGDHAESSTGSGTERHLERTLWGLELRYVLTLTLLDAGRVLTVAELARAIESHGFQLHGRPSKTISDALRTEAGRGRVVREGHDRYRSGTMPRQTRHRIRARAGAAIREARAARLAEDDLHG